MTATTTTAKRAPNYDKFPTVPVAGHAGDCWRGWPAVCDRLAKAVGELGRKKTVLAVECYTGIYDEEVLPALREGLRPALVIHALDAFLSPREVDRLIAQDLTADPVFGHLSLLTLDQFMADEKIAALAEKIAAAPEGLILVYGTGATLIAPEPDLLVYADLARWETQLRHRKNMMPNLGGDNLEERPALQYKRSFFIDWRVCDRVKKRLFERWDFVLDTNALGDPRLATGEAVRAGLRQAARRPFRVVPYFDPAPWGGHWMQEVCDLDRAAPNFGWCFDCVPEENSLLLQFGETTFELPSIDLVFYQPRQLLGEAVHARFGTEFPIRTDFLDTMGGGNLSFQVHPLTEYIQETFGMHYTQDESYYMLDCGEGASVYLGLKEGVDPRAMIGDLLAADKGGAPFPAERYANQWPAQKHDHFLIPAGTVHCSGAEAMVLEISATPYIFTFKLWDWGRLGLDGRPRPTHINHGRLVIQWDRTTAWVRANLVNRITPLGRGEGWREERTGLHEREFIETRRHWFTAPVPHHTRGTLNVINLVEGEEALVESPSGAFEPFVVHYAETFIVPAAVGPYTIRPWGRSEGKACATLKIYVRDGLPRGD